MNGESGTADGTFDVQQHYGPRTLSGSGTAQFENSNYGDDPEEHYANDIVMENANLDRMDGEYGTMVHFGAM